MLSPASPGRLIGAIAIAGAGFAAHAEEFSWRLSGGMSRAEVADFSRDSWAVDGTYYVDPIDDSRGPYELASFLNPTTRVSAAASKADADYFLSDPAVYTLSGAFVLPGEKWYVGANYSKSIFDNAPIATYSDSKGYGLSAGRYLGPNTTLELGLGGSEQDVTLCTAFSSATGCFGPLIETETTTDSVDLEVFHVRRFRSLTYSLQGRVSEIDSDFEARSAVPQLVSNSASSRRVYSVATELFPTQRLGMRVGYSQPDSDVDIDAYDVGATWFFKPRVAVQFVFSRTNFDTVPGFGPSHSDNAGVRFIGRL
jgi:hypothetical protein